MKAIHIVVTVLLTIAMACGCIGLIWFSVDMWRTLVEYDRDTLGNYDEVLVEAILFSAPALLIIGILAVTGMRVACSSDRAQIAKLRWICSWALFGFAASLAAIAIWLTITSRGEGAGFAIYFTAPMMIFALLIPTSLGFIVSPTKNQNG